MRKLFEQLTRSLRYFVKQRDDLLMLIPCADADVPLIMMALRDIDRHSPSDLFLLFADAFENPGQFVTAMANKLQEELTLTNGAAGPKDEKLPPLPADWQDATKPAPVRLIAGLKYAQALVDPRHGQHYVWGMGPLTIQNPKNYLELLAELTPKPDILPWMRGARIIARVPADFKLQSSPLANASRVNVEPFVIPPNAHEEELLITAADPKISMGDRMQAEVQLAYLDVAYQRFDAAHERFWTALAFFQWAGIPAMEGLIISGLGDIARGKEDWEKAKHWYACAVPPAVASGNPVLLANIVQNLAGIAYAQKQFAEAEERFAELVELKRAAFDEDGLTEALEWQGICQEKQEAVDRAVLSWEEAALISKTFELEHRLTPMLAHLKRGYQRLGLRENLAEFDAAWKG